MTKQLSIFTIVLCVFMLVNAIEVRSTPAGREPALDIRPAIQIDTDTNNTVYALSPSFSFSGISRIPRSPSVTSKYRPSGVFLPPLETRLPTNVVTGTVTESSGNSNTILATSSRPPVDDNGTKPGGCGVHWKTEIKIVGGQPAHKDEWPWMAALLRDKNNQYCGGALITDRHILTAAHCVNDFRPAEVMVRLGEYDFTKTDGGEKDFEVEKIILHEDYNSSTAMHDIAVLKLKKTTSFTKSISPICLPSKELDLDHQGCYVTGWGSTSFGGVSSDVLLEALVPVWNNSMCLKAQDQRVNTDIQLCAGHMKGEKDSCQGDSGGPLMYMTEDGRWTVVGVVSWGFRCALAGKPGVYGKVSYYVPWIKQAISNNSLVFNLN